MAETDLPPGVINIVHGRGSGRRQRAGLVAARRHDQFHRQRRNRIGHHVRGGRQHHQGESGTGRKGARHCDGRCRYGLAVRAIKASRVINSGQVCNCAERVYVQAAVADDFVEELAAAMKATRFGNPLADESVEYGPLINEAGYRKVERLVRGAVAGGPPR